MTVAQKRLASSRLLTRQQRCRYDAHCSAVNWFAFPAKSVETPEPTRTITSATTEITGSTSNSCAVAIMPRVTAARS